MFGRGFCSRSYCFEFSYPISVWAFRPSFPPKPTTPHGFSVHLRFTRILSPTISPSLSMYLFCHSFDPRAHSWTFFPVSVSFCFFSFSYYLYLFFLCHPERPTSSPFSSNRAALLVPSIFIFDFRVTRRTNILNAPRGRFWRYLSTPYPRPLRYDHIYTI